METRFANYLHSELTDRIIGSALAVHRALGPGLLEGAYRACLAQRLRSDGLDVRQEVPIPLKFDGVELDVSYRADLIVEGKVLLELKAIQQLGTPARIAATDLSEALRHTRWPSSQLQRHSAAIRHSQDRPLDLSASLSDLSAFSVLSVRCL
jgi:GxxExxY protein